jgi:hypothetical protein
MSKEYTNFIQTGVKQVMPEGTITFSGNLPIDWCGNGFSLGGIVPSPKNYKPKKVVFVEGLLAKVYFDDGSLFVVKCLPEDEEFFSEEIATALAIQKKIFHDSKSERDIVEYIDKIAIRHPRITEKVEKIKKKV